MPITPEDIAVLWNVPPEQAVKFIQRKGLKINKTRWNAIRAEVHARAFTVTGVLKLDVLQHINDQLKIAQAEGKPMEQFRRDVTKSLESAGYTTEGTVLTPSRLELVYRQNLQSSYQAGRHFKQRNVIDKHADLFPLFEVLVVDDDATSEICEQFIDNNIFPVSRYDEVNFPAHFFCRSQKRLISKFEARRRDLIPNGPDEIVTTEGFDIPPSLKFQPDLSGYDSALKTQYMNATKRGN